MTTSPTIHDVMFSIASRRREMDLIRENVKELLYRVKKLNQRHDELKSLNFLDAILLKELKEKCHQ